MAVSLNTHANIFLLRDSEYLLSLMKAGIGAALRINETVAFIRGFAASVHGQHLPQSHVEKLMFCSC